MKKYFSSLVLAVFIFSTILFPQSLVAADQFPDVVSDHPHSTAIQWIKDKSIVQGYSDGTFHPDDTVSRAEFSKIMINSVYDAVAIQNCTTEKKFPDVIVGSWEEDYICVAFESDTIQGFEDGTFRPWAPVSLHEAYKILAGAFGWEPQETTDPWWIGYEQFFQGERAPASIGVVEDKLTRGGMAQLIYSFNRNTTSNNLLYHGRFIVSKSLNLELLTYEGVQSREKFQVSAYPKDGKVYQLLQVMAFDGLEWDEVYREELDVRTAPLLGFVDNGAGKTGAVVINSYNGAGTSTNWFMLAEADGVIVKLEVTGRESVLDAYDYQDMGYNAVNISGNTITENIPGYSKAASRCCTDKEPISIDYIFDGDAIVVEAVVVSEEGVE